MRREASRRVQVWREKERALRAALRVRFVLVHASVKVTLEAWLASREQKTCLGPG